ncbi:hypothetical protein RMATCC62417_14698 [Rhizopus microsporus]|nr:hypothetical protein RMATCC62417_14698 [Rhizopus microsporus]
MLVLPGLKTIRVNGYLKNQTPVDSSTSFQERHVKRKREFIEHEPSSNIAVLQTNIDALKRQLLQLNSQRRSLLINNNVRKLKNEWIDCRSRRLTYTEEAKNYETFQMINNAKKARDEVNLKIIETKQQLSDARQSMYSGVVRATPDEIAHQHKRTNTRDDYKIMDEFEKLKVDRDFLIFDKLKFSGTDNGLITMIETVPFSLSRFRFHLDLYNKSIYISYSHILLT